MSLKNSKSGVAAATTSSSATVKAAGTAANKTEKPPMPKYPIACWRSVVDLHGDPIFGPHTLCTRVDLLKKGMCPFLGKVQVVVKESEDDDDDDDSTSDEEEEKKTKTKTISAFICCARMPAKRVQGQSLCDAHHEEFLARCAERDAIREQREAKWLADQAAWQEREARRAAAKERYEQQQQRQVQRQQRQENDPAYLHARHDEIFQEVEQERFLADGTRETRTTPMKVFEQDVYYTRWQIKDAGYCAFLHTEENGNCAFRCTSPLDPKHPRDAMCQSHMAVWRQEMQRRKNVGKGDGEWHNATKSNKSDSAASASTSAASEPTLPSYASIAIQGEQKAAEASMSKKQLKKKKKAEKAAADAASAAVASSTSSTAAFNNEASTMKNVAVVDDIVDTVVAAVEKKQEQKQQQQQQKQQKKKN